MGQYWMPVNLTKREFVSPHKLGTGLKLWEQLASHPGTPSALLILLSAMPEPRGGGDFDLDNNWHGPERDMNNPDYHGAPGPMPDAYPVVAKRTIGRWAGDQIALIGDYAESDDLPGQSGADLIYSLCQAPEDGDFEAQIEHLSDNDKVTARELGAFTDVSDDVAAVIEHELGGRFVGPGWKQWRKLEDLCSSCGKWKRAYEDPCACEENSDATS